jgi:hypothetical protein
VGAWKLNKGRKSRFLIVSIYSSTISYPFLCQLYKNLMLKEKPARIGQAFLRAYWVYANLRI